jgi:bacteriocin biosynthesis cyclodehydratase domain-containing protein
MTENQNRKLYSLPVEVIPIQGGIILKRGCMELRIKGERVEDVLNSFLSLSRRPSGVTQEELCLQFGSPSHSGIERLIDQLILRRILVTDSTHTGEHTAQESALEVFYWHFDSTPIEAELHLANKTLVVLGAGTLSQSIVRSLSLAGFKDVRTIPHQVVDYDDNSRTVGGLVSDEPISTELFAHLPAAYDCLVMASDFGMSPAFHEVNRFCVEQERKFLPVTIQNMIGYIGPLVIPGETACYECLHRRIQSHLPDPETSRAIESHNFRQQRIVSHHPLMLSALADLAAFELLRYFSNVLDYEPGTLLEVSFLARRMESRRVLKLPRCPTCSPLMTRPSTTLNKAMFTFEG